MKILLNNNFLPLLNRLTICEKCFRFWGERSISKGDRKTLDDKCKLKFSFFSQQFPSNSLYCDTWTIQNIQSLTWVDIKCRESEQKHVEISKNNCYAMPLRDEKKLYNQVRFFFHQMEFQSWIFYSNNFLHSSSLKAFVKFAHYINAATKRQQISLKAILTMRANFFPSRLR